MKITAALILASLLTVGCTQTIIKKEIVTVDKPVPFVPAPPNVPQFQSQIDQLKPEDIADPGKIGMAYKYDITMLRSLVKIYQDILAQYKDSSVNFDKINEEITKMYEQINKAEQKAVDSIATPLP